MNRLSFSLVVKILVAVVVMEVLGGLGALVTSSQIPQWYAYLQKPPGNPPNWVFGPVWGTLYALIGIAFAIIWHQAKAGPNKRLALVFFSAQLLLNLAWTPVFFGRHQMLAALVIIVLLWISIALTIRYFHRLAPVAAYLLIPYLLWVSYATYLNAALWWLNRSS